MSRSEKSLPFRRQHADDRIFGEVLLVHPRELRKQLQIAPVALAEIRDAGFDAAGAQLRLQLGETWPTLNVILIQLKGAIEDFSFLCGIKFVRSGESKFEPGLAELSAGIFLNLLAKGGDKIEGSVNSGKFAQDFHHAPVVFQRVQPRPGEHVAPRPGVAILRLMHMPD